MKTAKRISPTKVLVLRFWPRELKYKTRHFFKYKNTQNVINNWISKTKAKCMYMEISKRKQTLSFSVPTKSNRRVWTRIFAFLLSETEEHQEIYQNQSHLDLLYLLISGEGKKNLEAKRFRFCFLHSISSLKNMSQSSYMRRANMYLGVLLRSNTRRLRLPEITELHLLKRTFVQEWNLISTVHIQFIFQNHITFAFWWNITYIRWQCS